MATSKKRLLELLGRLESIFMADSSFKVFIGFDGFVDLIQKAVKKKEEKKNLYFNTIKEFSAHLNTLSGKSGQVELTTTQVKAGGNAPILANALGNVGTKSYCLGAMGLPALQSVFKTIHKECEKISVCNPGKSQAIEFDDGKIILSDLEVFNEYDWNFIKDKIGLQKMREYAKEADAFAFVDWVNLPEASAIWQGFLDDIIKPIKKKDAIFLFDLCDPSKKSAQQIDEVLDLISSFSRYGRVTLGLNENETYKIWLAMNGKDFRSVQPNVILPDIKKAGSFIYHSMNIESLLVHPIDRSLVFRKDGIIELAGRFVKQPKVQTGGGDNLNAGFLLGLLAGLDIQLCMLLGMAASGAYVQNGYSADKQDLTEYIEVWAKEINGETTEIKEPLEVYRDKGRLSVMQLISQYYT